MKKISIFLIVFMLAGFGMSCKKKATFGELLIEFEQSVNERSKTPDWAQKRVRWEQDVKNSAQNLHSMKKLVVEFESNIKYSAQRVNWRNRRSGWMDGIEMCTNFNEMKNLLIELESSMEFQGQKPEWQERRGGWIADVQELE